MNIKRCAVIFNFFDVAECGNIHFFVYYFTKVDYYKNANSQNIHKAVTVVVKSR